MSRKKRNRKKPAPSKTLTLCVASYYDPTKHVCGKEPEIVRATAVVYDIVACKVVERLEFNSSEHSLDDATDQFVALAAKYNAVLRLISEPVPLEKCECGCDGYLDRIITAEDLAASPN